MIIESITEIMKMNFYLGPSLKKEAVREGMVTLVNSESSHKVKFTPQMTVSDLLEVYIRESKIEAQIGQLVLVVNGKLMQRA